MTLELGGNGAVVVHEDADLDYAATRCAFGGFLRAGQACISVQRLYVHESVFEPFREKLVARIKDLRTGDPREDETTLAGLIDDAAAAKTMGLIEEALAAGATVLHGGTRTGSVIEPTLLADVSEELRVCAEEAFRARRRPPLRYRDLENRLRACATIPLRPASRPLHTRHPRRQPCVRKTRRSAR